MKKPIGSQFSFSNLDGARASISSEDRLSISFERQEAVEVGEEEGTKEEEEWTEEEKRWEEKEEEDEKREFDEWVKMNWGKYPPFHREELEEKWKKRKEQMKEERLTDNGPQDILPHLGGLWLGVCFWK